jgi:hypothetical protein
MAKRKGAPVQFNCELKENGMQKININDIKPASFNHRVEELATAIVNPVSDIEVVHEDGGFKVVNGNIRLDVQLELQGTALVRVLGTNEQFSVRKEPDGSIVRV